MELTPPPVRRAVERIVYRMPVEITNPNGDFVIRASLCDVSALAARVEFLRAPRLRLGDPVILNLSRNFNVEGLRSSFQIHAVVLMRRSAEQLVLMFANPRSLVQEGFVRYVYGPLLKAAKTAPPTLTSQQDSDPKRTSRPRRPHLTHEKTEEGEEASRSLRWRASRHSPTGRGRHR